MMINMNCIFQNVFRNRPCATGNIANTQNITTTNTNNGNNGGSYQLSILVPALADYPWALSNISLCVCFSFFAGEGKIVC